VDTGGDRAPMADSDRDGTVNLLEYALNSSPRDPGSLPILTPALTEEGRLTLTFMRHAAPELIYAVEFSPALSPASWQEAFRSSGPLNTAGPVTVVDPSPGPAPRGFVRLKVTLEEP